jgi:hypothetical protein
MNNKISEGLKAYWASGAAAGRRAKDKAVSTIKGAGASAKKMADRDGDNKITRNDVKTGVKQVGAAVRTRARSVRTRANRAYNNVANAIVERRSGPTQARATVDSNSQMTVTARRPRS